MTMTEAHLQFPTRAPARIEYADALRVMAILMVVCIHVAGPLLISTPGTKKWLFGNLLDAISRPSVPLFLMLSGMLLLSPERIAPLKVFFKRRFARVVGPLIAWALIYFLWNSFFHNAPLKWETFIPNLLSGNVYYHLGFLYILIGLYFLVPFLQQFTCVAKDRDYIYILSFWMVCVAITPLMKKFLGLSISSNLQPIAEFTGFFIAGYYFSRFPVIRTRYVVIILLLAMTATFFGVLFTSQASGKFDQYFYGSTTLNGILASFAWFLLFKKIPFEAVYARAPWLKKVITVGSSISFSVYLLHIMVLEALGSGRLGFVLAANTINPLFGVSISIIVTVLISSFIILVMRRIPVIKYLFQ